MSPLELDRRDVLAGVGAAALAGGAASAAAAPGSRPNLVLFFLDELRADALACYGNPVTRTPNFDALAAQGTRFAECHVQNPVCAQRLTLSGKVAWAKASFLPNQKTS